jgi:hypothetical protein
MNKIWTNQEKIENNLYSLNIISGARDASFGVPRKSVFHATTNPNVME